MNIIKSFAFIPTDLIYVLAPLRMHLKVLWTALNVFSMDLGGNRRWVPPSFENNNINNKRYRAHKFYFTISSAVSSIQLHSRGHIFPFPWAENPRPRHQFGQELFI